jgi:outer membrane protein insertion porin family
MLHKHIKIFVIVFVFFFSLDSHKLLNAQGNEAASAVVKQIEFKGNDRVSSSTIKAAIKTNQGDIYDPKAISQDVDAIWLLGFFDNIEVEVEPYEDGVKVIFLVLERPVIKSILFAGNGGVKTRKLRETIQLFTKIGRRQNSRDLSEQRIFTH